MKKARTVLVAVLLFCFAAWLLFPWAALQSYITARAFKIAANNGIFVSVRGYEPHGKFDTEFEYNGVQADFPLLCFKTDSLLVNPKIIRSLFGNYSVAVTLGKGCLEPVTRQQLPWNSGYAEIYANKETLFLRDITITGAFSARGFVEVSRADGRISRAQLSMRVPPEADSAFEFLSKGALRGLSKDASGSWRLVR